MTEKEQLLESLVEKTDKSAEEIQKLVAEKVNELSGLVSEEGAIYIVANELGVKLDSDKPKRALNEVKIEDITEPKEPVSFVCKVIRKYDRVSFSSQNGTEGSVQSLLVGDDTGITRLVFWNEQTELLDTIQERDVLRIVNAYTRQNANSERIEVHYGQYSDIEVNPEGIEVTLKEFTPSDIEFTKKKVTELEEGERNVELEGIITDVEVPRFYLACPKTFKKVFQDEGKYFSPTEGEVEPIRVPIVSMMIDDGSGTVGVVAFRDRAENLTELSSDELVGLSEDIEKYREFSNKLVGSKVKLGGNVGTNAMTSEKQLLINQVLGVEFKSVEEIAQDLAKEDDKEKEEAPQKEEKKKEEKKQPKQEESDEDLDLDLEEIDIDDDLM